MVLLAHDERLSGADENIRCLIQFRQAQDLSATLNEGSPLDLESGNLWESCAVTKLRFLQCLCLTHASLIHDIYHILSSSVLAFSSLEYEFTIKLCNYANFYAPKSC